MDNFRKIAIEYAKKEGITPLGWQVKKIIMFILEPSIRKI